jgi:Hypothetical glycosyl hydrolase family 15
MKRLLVLVVLAATILVGCSGQTDPATNVTATSATLHGKVTCAEGESGTQWWRYRKGSDPWVETAHVPFTCPEGGAQNFPLTYPLSGLTPGSHYRFEICGQPGESPLCVNAVGQVDLHPNNPREPVDAFDTLPSTLAVAGHLRYAVDNNPDFSNLWVSTQRNNYVILKDAHLSQARQMKAANPSLQILVYKNLTGSRTDCTTPTSNCTAGVTYQQADSQHPEWFLLNKQGQRIRFNDYQDLWAMDVGSPSYQAQWAENVVTEIQRDGWDGVFLDDTNATMKYHYDPTNIAKYPSDSAWQGATRSAIANIAPRIGVAGKFTIANLGGWLDYPSVGDSWLQYLDGAMQEHFAKWGSSAGSGYADQGTWQIELNSAKYAQSQGKIFLGETNSADGDRVAARYGWASILLATMGSAHFALHGNYTYENWFPEYDYAIGIPTGPEKTDANGVHRRVFKNGIVVVNPTGGQLSANLGGTYSGSGLTNVMSVTLPAHSAYVLTASN